MSEDAIPRIPDLEATTLEFLLTVDDAAVRADAAAKLVEKVVKHDMGPYYRKLTAEYPALVLADAALQADLDRKNEEELKKLEDRIEDATQNLGETDISDALTAKALYLSQIGDKEKALSAYRVAHDKTSPLGSRIDIVFAITRIGFFFRDDDTISRNIEKLKSLIEEGGDWDRRNRLKVYEGIYQLSIRNFQGAVNLLLDSLATFTSTELMDYKDFVRYTVLAACLALNRPDMKKKVLNAPEILEVIHEIPHLEDYMTSLYNGEYAKFFNALAAVEHSLKLDRILAAHYRFYVREMRIIAYTQLLESYRSLTIESMANSFGVTEEFIDKWVLRSVCRAVADDRARSDLSRFIASQRLNAVIDKVAGIVETNRPDAKNAQYQSAIKQGDALLNRIQKLASYVAV
ncbi:26S proteasome subunit RPN7-domain-containing protein [Hyaloraphidium curvatum]|nr:26S proteasome subunit RPN7-domain-containing protein [Hyaloraphidium curvatum]